jgi:hypothetical protein
MRLLNILLWAEVVALVCGLVATFMAVISLVAR